MTPKEKAKDKRLQKLYGWTLARYYALERVQEGRCGICGRLPKDKSLNVDHQHFHIVSRRFTKEEIILSAPSGAKWWTTVKEFPDINIWSLTKKSGIEAVKKIALPRSVRGLLCPGRYRGCNRLLGRIDDIEWLQKAIAYLQDPPALKLNLEKKDGI